MPTYEYECDACGHAFEKFHSMSAEPVRKCPNCGKNKVRRLIGVGAGLIFKGSGFYITDYREAGYKEKAKADGPPEAAKEGASSGSTDANSSGGKPATDAKSGSESKSGNESKSGESKSGGESKSSGDTKGPAPKPSGDAKPASKPDSKGPSGKPKK